MRITPILSERHEKSDILISKDKGQIFLKRI